MCEPTSLRVGILVDSPLVTSWEASLVERLRETASVAHLVLIVTGDPPGLPTKSLRSKLSSIPFRLIHRLERFKLERSEMFGSSFDVTDITARFDHVLDVSPEWSVTGLSWTLSEVDFEAVGAIDVDVLIRMGSGIIRGRVLSASRLGVLSLHHGDNRKYRGVPAGVWEVLNRESTSGFIIQKLTEELDGGAVIARGTITTQCYFLRNQAHLFTASIPRFVGVIEHASAKGQLPLADDAVPFDLSSFARLARRMHPNCEGDSGSTAILPGRR